jgi:lipoprotein-releasing system ATP-binding protein
MFDNKRSRMRNKMLGFVLQYLHMLPDFTVRKNVSMPFLIAGINKKEATEIAEKLLKM